MKEDLLLIEEKHPLIHNITNYVAMNFVANCLLAIGASPIMARAPEEVGEISSCCDALALNLGILEKNSIKAMQIAGMAAKRNDSPTVLDVVGVGATSFRMKAAMEIISSCHPTVVKGNASEIQALYTHQVAEAGIDSSIESKEIKEQAELLAKRLSPEELNHELIHSEQAKELLYLPFYMWYLVEWCFLFIKTKDWMKAYQKVRFEKEAYAHQNELGYLQHRKHYPYISIAR